MTCPMQVGDFCVAPYVDGNNMVAYYRAQITKRENRIVEVRIDNIGRLQFYRLLVRETET